MRGADRELLAFAPHAIMYRLSPHFGGSMKRSWANHFSSIIAALAILVSTTQIALAQSPRNVSEKDDLTNASRVALVIGNSAYKDSPLINPVNDAADMAKALADAGFMVTLKQNANTRDMRQAIRDFGTDLRRAQVGLFYFAGHGIQVKGGNYLVPVGADIQNEADAEDLSIDAGFVLRTMEDAQVRVSIVVLDACRNNPFARSFRSASRGLAQMTAATGSLVAFATAPGSVAADGNGRNGIYTKHLLASLREADTDILKVFQRTRARVVKETGGKQTPWESTSLVGDFYFQPVTQVGALTEQSADTARSRQVAAAEIPFWQSIKDSKSKADYQAYLDRYPNGEFAVLAKSRTGQGHQDLIALITALPNPYSATPETNTTSGIPMMNGIAARSLKDKASGTQLNELLAIYRGDAEAGDPVAQFSLGNMYQSGLGIGQDSNEAMKWFHRAADQGVALAQSTLGYMYANGAGIAKDEAEAVKWYRKAAERGEVYAQSGLGWMYANGLGIAKDETEAVRWYRKAAEQGEAYAQSGLGWMYANGLGIAKDEVEAVKWFRKAADQGVALAQSGLGYMYANGLGIAKDYAEALKWYRKAAAQGNTFAQESLKKLDAR